jgi:hypothetical protein
MAQLMADDIKAMIRNKEHETRSLDFKQELPGPTDSDKVEFLSDVAAMANAGGGRLLFGVEEERDANGQPTGVAGAAPGIEDKNPGQAILRLEQILQRGLEPRVPGCRFHQFAGFEKGPVIVLEVPRSWLAPHMVCHQERQLFYSRHGSGKYRLDVAEIRAAFLASEGVETKMRRFRDERLGRIVADDTPVKLKTGPRCAVYLVPLEALSGATSLDPRKIVEQYPLLAPLLFSWRFNIDGVVFHGGSRDETCEEFVQVFRTGAIESVIADYWFTDGDEPHLAAKLLEGRLEGLVARQLEGLAAVGVNAPVVLFGALLNARGFCVPVQQRIVTRRHHTFDRDVVMLPDGLCEDLGQDSRELLRPLFEAIYQASGYMRPDGG